VMRFVAKHHAAAAHDEAGHVASAGLTLFTIAGTMAMVLACGLALTVDRWTTIPPQQIETARVVILISGLNIAIALVSGVFGGVVTAMQRFDLSSGAALVIEVGRALAVFLALRWGGGLIALALVQLSASLASGFASWCFARKLYPALHLRWRGWHRDHLRAILAFSATSTLLHLATTAVVQMDAIVIGSALPVGMITFFAIAANLTQYARTLISGISQTISPRLSALQGAGATHELAQLPITSARVATLALLPVVVTFIFRGGSFIGLWMGPQYTQLSGQILWILSLALWFAAGRQVITAALMGLDLHRYLLPAFISEAVLILGSSLWLVRHVGIVGVAWGTTVPSLVISLVVVPFIFARLSRLAFGNVVAGIWLRPSLAIVPFAVATWAVERFWPTDSIVEFGGQIALVLPLAIAGAWWIGLTPAERTRYAPQVASRVRAFSS